MYKIIQQQFANRSMKQLGLLSFFARVYTNETCGVNGLPLIPNSIRIYGKFQYLKTLVHKNICRYVDIQRGAHERIFIISEHYPLTLNDLLNDNYLYNLLIANTQILVKWIHQILAAFSYINSRGINHRCLHLRHFCVTPEGNIKMINYGLFYMSEYGFCVNFPVVNLVTLPPECIILEYHYANKFSSHPANNKEQNISLNNPKSDVWSLGVCLFQFFFALNDLNETVTLLTNEVIIKSKI
jgi:TBC domain-containing protein kinase-like protein